MHTAVKIFLLAILIFEGYSYFYLIPYEAPFGAAFQITMILGGVETLILGYYVLDYFFSQEDDTSFEELEERVTALEERERKETSEY